MSKPFRGIISNYAFYKLSGGSSEVVEGHSMYHVNDSRRNGIRSGVGIMRTSLVTKKTDMDGYIEIETRNSRYLLVDPLP